MVRGQDSFYSNRSSSVKERVQRELLGNSGFC